MSGEKDSFVNLRQSQLNRLMSSAQRVDDLERNVKANVDRMGGELRADMDRRARALEARAAAEARRVDGLSTELQALERETGRRLAEQSAAFQAGLSELDQSMSGRIRGLSARVERGFAEIDARLTSQRTEYLDLIASQSRDFTRRMDAQRHELGGRIQAVQESMRRRLQSERQLAEAWVKDARALLDLVAAQHRPEKFAAGRVDALRSQLLLAEGNLRQEVFQAAVATAQQVYVETMELRLTLLEREQEYEALLRAARLGADEVLALLDAQSACRFLFETSEEATEIEGRVDFWTGGALSILLQEARKEREDLKASEAPRPERPQGMTSDDLRQSIARNEQRRRACLLLVEHARQAILSSQVRWQMGGVITDALREAGWEVVQEAWQGGDQRGAFHVKLGNLAGDEVVSVISPVEGEGGLRNHLNVNFYDRSQNDENVRRHRLETILRSLTAEGLEATPPTCPPGTENRAAADERKLDLDTVERTPLRTKPVRLG